MAAKKKNFTSPKKADGSVLPFPPTPSASIAGVTLQQSKHKRRVEKSRLPKDAPNILIVLLDDVGFGLPDTYGGVIRTPTLTRVANEGISYNRFHTTAICSPTRAALLTGRNHQRVGNGTIAERAVDWDGYLGVIPKTSATLAETLRHYGYKTAAFGKWHNTPADQTTAMGPFDRWPTGHGFDYFYGFMAGETSQWEPRLYENVNPIEPPHDERYHLSEDLAERALTWMKQHRAYAPDKPFFMYWAPGAAHGPHHIFKEWADKYKGQFDDGWDAMRERIFKRQKELGWIPADAKLTPRADTMPAWDTIPESERPFQRRLMEVFAGFAEHVDAQVGKVVDGLDELGIGENTIVFYIWGDNGSSAEGQNGSISELLAQNQIPNTVQQQIEALNKIGGLDALGGPKVDNMYHAGWAWAGDTPFHHTKLIASHFGGTRNPMAVSWPARIKPDKTPRSQFHHVNDIVPTIYEILGIKPPKVVDGFKQDPIDGTSMVYTFASAKAPGRKSIQYFDNNGSRGIYHDGWYACTFGPLTPWLTVSPGLATWDSNKDVWELYDLKTDFSQADDLASKDPKRLETDESAVPQGSQGEQGVSHRRGHLAAHSSGRPSEVALHELEVRRDDDPHAGVHRTRPGPREQPGGDRCRSRGGRFRRPVRTGRRVRGADALHGQGAARVRVQHDGHRAVPGAQQRESGAGQTPHRSRDDAHGARARSRPPRLFSQ